MRNDYLFEIAELTSLKTLERVTEKASGTLDSRASPIAALTAPRWSLQSGLLTEKQLGEGTTLCTDTVEVFATDGSCHSLVGLLGEVADGARPVDFSRCIPLIGLELFIQLGLGWYLDRKPLVKHGFGLLHASVLYVPTLLLSTARWL
jgi:hypothetical protein